MYRVSPCALRLVDDKCIMDSENNNENNVTVEMDMFSEQYDNGVTNGVIDYGDNGVELNAMELLREFENYDDLLETTRDINTQRDHPVCPNLGQRVKFVDPDSGRMQEFIVVSRAGKSTGKFANWRNVSNCTTNAIKSVDFSIIDQWEPVNCEIAMAVSTSNQDVLSAKVQELANWKQYNVYSEVPNEGQSYVNVRWVVSEKYKSGKLVTKARLVAKGYEEDTSGIEKRSPTCGKEFIRLVNCIAVANSWKISSLM